MLSEVQKRLWIAHLCLVVLAVLLVADLILFHDNEEVMGAVGIAAFAFSMWLLMALDRRVDRIEASKHKSQT